MIAECLNESAAQPEWLKLEITETAFLTDPRRALQIVQEIRDLGVQLSIDDFGTGYSSLEYLQKLPIQELKVDRSFVSNMLSNPNDRTIVRSTVRMAHDLNLTVVAEGVEDYATLVELEKVDCDVAQGFWISRPLSFEAFTTFLKQWSLEALNGPRRAVP